MNFGPKSEGSLNEYNFLIKLKTNIADLCGLFKKKFMRKIMVKFLPAFTFIFALSSESSVRNELRQIGLIGGLSDSAFINP